MNKGLWLWSVLLFILDFSCSAYDPYFALQQWPLELPHWFRPVVTAPDSAPFHTPALQSPINIRTSHAAAVRLPPLVFKDLYSDQVQLLITNTGTTVELELPEETPWKPHIFGGPLFEAGVFEFNNLHIHWGSKDFSGGEHKLDSRRFAIEGHCVHFNIKYGNITEAMKHSDGLAVVAFFGKVFKTLGRENSLAYVCFLNSELPEYSRTLIRRLSRGFWKESRYQGSLLIEAGHMDNPLMEGLVQSLRYIRRPGTSTSLSARAALAWFDRLGAARGYFTYPGSLTTAPYSENVVWIVYPEPVSLSRRQVEAFRNIVSDNHRLLRKNIRPIQAFNGRPLIYAL